MGELFTTGGHAVFVWFSYAFGIVGLVVLAVANRWNLKRREAELKKLQATLGSRRGIYITSSNKGKGDSS